MQKTCAIVSNAGVFLAAKGWAQSSQWCFRCPVLHAELMLVLGLRGTRFFKAGLASLLVPS